MFVITQTDSARVQCLNYDDVAKISIGERHLLRIKASVCAHTGTEDGLKLGNEPPHVCVQEVTVCPIRYCHVHRDSLECQHSPVPELFIYQISESGWFLKEVLCCADWHCCSLSTGSGRGSYETFPVSPVLCFSYLGSIVRMRSEDLCGDDTGMDGVAGAGLRFICGGKVRDYTVTILGTTMLARCVCVCVCE